MIKKTIVSFPVYNKTTNSGEILKFILSKKKPKNYLVLNDDFKLEVDNAYKEVRDYIEKNYHSVKLWEVLNYYVPCLNSSYQKNISGKSVGLAAFIAYFSYIFNLEVPENYFFSAEIFNLKLKPVTKLKEKLQVIKNNYDSDYKLFISKDNNEKFLLNNKNIFWFDEISEVINELYSKSQIHSALNKWKKIDLNKTLAVAQNQYKKHQYKIAYDNFINLKNILSRSKKRDIHYNDNMLKILINLGVIKTHYGQLKEAENFFKIGQKIIDNDADNTLSANTITNFLNTNSIVLFDYYLFQKAAKKLRQG